MVSRVFRIKPKRVCWQTHIEAWQWSGLSATAGLGAARSLQRPLPMIVPGRKEAIADLAKNDGAWGARWAEFDPIPTFTLLDLSVGLGITQRLSAKTTVSICHGQSEAAASFPGVTARLSSSCVTSAGPPHAVPLQARVLVV